MLSYALAIAVAISSFVLFLAAFFMSDIHRKDDFLWSAVGLFYALVLWFCARNITGAVLLGQASASALLISFTWQTLRLRKAIANPEQAAEIANFSLLKTANGLLKRNKNKIEPSVTNTPVAKESPDVVTESEIAIPQTTSNAAEKPATKTDVAQKQESKPSPIGKIFGKKKEAGITDTKLNEVLDEAEVEEKPVEEKPVEEKLVEQEIAAESPTTESQTNENPSPPAIDQKEEEIEAQTEVNSPEEKQAETNDDEQQETVDTSEQIPTESIESQKIEAKEPNSTEETEATATETENKSEIEQLLDTNPPADNSTEEQTVESSEDITSQDLEEADTTSEEDTTKEEEVIEPKTKTSSIDSLETVEVAEVLEALPENTLEKQNSDRSDIIEVTATDIEDEKESQQSYDDSSSDLKSDS